MIGIICGTWMPAVLAVLAFKYWVDVRYAKPEAAPVITEEDLDKAYQDCGDAPDFANVIQELMSDF